MAALLTSAFTTSLILLTYLRADNMTSPLLLLALAPPAVATALATVPGLQAQGLLGGAGARLIADDAASVATGPFPRAHWRCRGSMILGVLCYRHSQAQLPTSTALPCRGRGPVRRRAAAHHHILCVATRSHARRWRRAHGVALRYRGGTGADVLRGDSHAPLLRLRGCRAHGGSQLGAAASVQAAAPRRVDVQAAQRCCRWRQLPGAASIAAPIAAQAAVQIAAHIAEQAAAQAAGQTAAHIAAQAAAQIPQRASVTHAPLAERLPSPKSVHRTMFCAERASHPVLRRWRPL